MTISHQEIIDVLRPLVTVTEIFAKTPGCDHGNHTLEIDLADLWPLRKLVSRLDVEGEAPKPGAGARILAGLKDAAEGNFASVTIDGQRWGRQPEAPHIAPPASGDVSGRATEPVDIFIAQVLEPFARIPASVRDSVRNALASEYERGVAAGRLSGIEEAAMVADAYADEQDKSVRATVVARAIRSLITKEVKPETDPNAWAFKHGLESP